MKLSMDVQRKIYRLQTEYQTLQALGIRLVDLKRDRKEANERNLTLNVREKTLREELDKCRSQIESIEPEIKTALFAAMKGLL